MFGCTWLCEAALIQVVLALSVVFVCSGLVSIVNSCLRLIYVYFSSFYVSSVV